MTSATGIHLLTSGKLEADLSVLAEECGVPEALALIEMKRQTAEKVGLDASDENRHRAALERLGGALEDALTDSSLPEEPANRDRCESWLVELRKDELGRQ